MTKSGAEVQKDASGRVTQAEAVKVKYQTVRCQRLSRTLGS